MNKSPLNKSFYIQSDPLSISKLLLGKLIETKINNKITSGIIVETEAYLGFNDKASHSYQNKKTERNKNMFRKGGISYIYICYGIHTLFNIVINIEGIPQAVLIRAIEPISGIKYMEKRRHQKISYNLTSGPGKLTLALGIKLKNNGCSLSGPNITIKDIGINIDRIICSPRVGVEYAQEDALKPWRFQIANNPWVSRAS